MCAVAKRVLGLGIVGAPQLGLYHLNAIPWIVGSLFDTAHERHKATEALLSDPSTHRGPPSCLNE